MLNGMASKAVRIARGTTLVLGLAVMLALMLALTAGAAEAAKAKSLKAGVQNAVSVVTSMVGSVAGPVLRLDNNSTSEGAAALDLQVEAGKAPLTVSEGASKATNLDADKLDGKDSSEFAPAGGFGATEVIDAFGRLPKEGTFTSKGGTLLISVSGSGFRGSGNAQRPGLIGMEIKVDGVTQDTSWIFANERDSHKAFVNDHIVLSGLSAGEHTIRLEASYDRSNCNTASERDVHPCTTTDTFDVFTASILELPG